MSDCMQPCAEHNRCAVCLKGQWRHHAKVYQEMRSALFVPHNNLGQVTVFPDQIQSLLNQRIRALRAHRRWKKKSREKNKPEI